MKNLIIFSLLIFSAIILENREVYADLSACKIKEVKSGSERIETLDRTYWIRLKDSKTYRAAASGIQSISDLELTPLLSSGRISEIDIRRKLKQEGLLSAGQASSFAIEDKISRTFTAVYSGNLSSPVFIAKLKKSHPEIETIEPYYVSELMRSPKSPNDPRLSEQYTYTKMQVQEAWAAGLTGSSDVIIAISDCGVMRKHEDLKSSLAYNTKEIPNNGIDDDGNGYVDDYAGYNFSWKSDKTAADSVEHTDSHGTNVAGICCATADNGKGGAGTGNQCRYFPLKVCRNGSTSVIYGYQSILYAAENRIPVINCSWGRTKPFSQVEQDIIDYAVSRGVSIVAASGNISYSASEVFYPANYRGVLGVGETDNNDHVSESSSVSLQTGIMAIGSGNLTCSLSSNGTNYEYTGGGTSFASPIIAGFLGLIRAKYPELSAYQAEEFARKCTDDITSINQNSNEFIGFLPGRVNFLKAAQDDPVSTTACSFVKVDYLDSTGARISRIRDYSGEITADITAENSLAAIENVTFRMSYLTALNTADFNITRADVSIASAAAGSNFNINGFKFISTGTHPDFAAFRIDVIKNGEVVDFFTFPLVNNSDITTYSNDSLVFSASDFGKFGSSVNEDLNYGSGFAPRSSLNLLSTASSIALTIDNNYVYSGLYGEYYKYSDFKPVKNFTGWDSTTGIMNVVNQAGYDMNITAKYTFPSQTLPLVRADLTLTNNGSKAISNPSLGLIFDWDIIPRVLENHSGYFPEALPAGADPVAVSAQYVTNFDSTEYIGTLVMSQTDQSVIAQSGAITSLTSNGDIMTLLNSASNAQTSETADIISGAGMKFSGSTAQGEKRSLIIFIGYSRSKADLAAMLKNAASTAKVDEVNNSASIIYPNPTDNLLEISAKTLFSHVDIYNESGKSVMQKAFKSGETEAEISVENLPFGAYFIMLDGKFAGKFVKK